MSYNGVDFDRYYDDLIGVTRSEKDRAHNVFLFIDKDHAPCILTKPLHHSQQLIQERENGIIIRLAPRHLAKKIRRRLEKANRRYEQETKND